jgi:hypothetical protein
MSRTRLAALAVTLTCSLLLGAAGSAAAQTSTAQPLTKVVPMTGTAKNGKKFKGTFTIDRFARSGDTLYAVGTLKGKLKNRKVTRRDVRIPAAVASGAQAAQIPPTTGACQILSLTLQPLDLNLLGLRVRTSRIDLLIEGVPGPGQLLGNLLCGILGILDPPTVANTPLGQLTQILNALLALSPRTA